MNWLYRPSELLSYYYKISKIKIENRKNKRQTRKYEATNPIFIIEQRDITSREKLIKEIKTQLLPLKIITIHDSKLRIHKVQKIIALFASEYTIYLNNSVQEANTNWWHSWLSQEKKKNTKWPRLLYSVEFIHIYEEDIYYKIHLEKSLVKKFPGLDFCRQATCAYRPILSTCLASPLVSFLQTLHVLSTHPSSTYCPSTINLICSQKNKKSS